MQSLFWHVVPSGHPLPQPMVKIEVCLVPSGSRSRFGENWKKGLKCVGEEMGHVLIAENTIFQP
jgi:hypothetical protein